MATVNLSAAAFCVNKLMAGAMEVALHSLFRASPELRKVYILHEDLSDVFCHSLVQRFSSHKFCFKKFDSSQFFGLRPLHGAYTPYAKLLIPELVSEEDRHVIYLDADLVVNTDLHSALNGLEAGPSFFAVDGGKAETSLDCRLYRDYGLKPGQLVFNSGVLMFDCPQCRESKMRVRALELGRRYADRLLSADQALLNLLFSRYRGCLPRRLNIVVFPTTPMLSEANDGIYHFVGSPKPWDFFGPLLHPNYPIFDRAMKAAGMGLWKVRGRISLRHLLRSIRIGRSYWVCLKNRNR
jgi:lipopolysaccharide biosynthesis glycosyltransferase